MIKILNTEQIRKVDQYTIQHEPVSAILLMERAAKAFVKQFEKDYSDKNIHKYVICGSGNNGGDGLAIARLLLNRSHKVTVFIFSSKKRSIDCNKNLGQLQKKYKRNIHTISDADFLQRISKDAIIIDAIFGTGLKENIKRNSLLYKVIKEINTRNLNVISVDIPSGLYADKILEGIAVNANKTYTFQFPKLAFLLPESGTYANNFTVLDIGLHPGIIKNTHTPYYFIRADDIQQKIKSRKKFSHKGNFGHAFIIAGSYGKIGAAVLCSRACLRIGTGLVTSHIPACGYEIFQSSVPEAMCSTDKNNNEITENLYDEKYDAIGIGPGIGTHKNTVAVFEMLLKDNKKPIVIDADGLNILSKNKKLLNLLAVNSVLTPHPKEFERLAGKWNNDFERLELQRKFSKKYKVIIVLKGAHTSISDIDGNVYFNSTGNAGMATGGSGDVLTGIITGLLAQRYKPLDSAIAGVYIHGLAADIALGKQSMESLLASDIIDHLGDAFKVIQRL
ncbi:MAG: bifunctional ADP-dependent NAD(P)H-hydrate dehydratase/NAD(P)H-hydrate epimerase [Bacteroidota bacterium]|nr:bifunctional ADP-dependent NAD(P)H-hydrate dehydratase/NAD(P)H-hydrate epimerase [Bacteroidota bacterium]